MPFATSQFVTSGSYRVIRQLGKGGCGAVYLAEDMVLGRLVAVKEVLSGQESSGEASEKLQQEHRIQARLDHPHIIKVYSIGVDAATGEVYGFCEYAEGGSLADLLAARQAQNQKLSEPEVVRIGLDMCAALTAVAAEQIVHRDVKPSNILLVTDASGAIQVVKLGDFGIARDPRERKTTIIKGNQSHPGTSGYMPPEQYKAQNELDVRSDLFALGITLWELLTGKDYKLLLAAGKPVLRDHAPQASVGMGNILARLLEPNPNKRYQNPSELERALHKLLPASVRRTTILTTSNSLTSLTPPPGKQYWKWYMMVIVFVTILSSVILLLRNLSFSLPFTTVASSHTSVANDIINSVTSTTADLAIATTIPTVNTRATQNAVRAVQTSTAAREQTSTAQSFQVTTAALTATAIEMAVRETIAMQQTVVALPSPTIIIPTRIPSTPIRPTRVPPTPMPPTSVPTVPIASQIPIPAATVTPQVARDLQFDGNWRGKTSEGTTIDYTVQDGIIVTLIIGNCDGSIRGGAVFDGSPIVNRQISAMSDFAGYQLSGRFDTNNSASGTYNITSWDKCPAVSGTWSVSRQ